MITGHDGAEATVKIRPHGPAGIWYFMAGSSFAGIAAFAIADARVVPALLYLALALSHASLGLLTRSAGIDLTPQFAVLPTLRRRRVRWPGVQAVVSNQNSGGTSTVWLMLENGEPVKLRYPTTLWRKGDAQYEQDFEQIEKWWLAHRGASWHPVSPPVIETPAAMMHIDACE